jgi:dipeptidase E
MAANLLLLSNSTCFGMGYLDHAAPAIAALLEGVRRVAFVPYALRDQAAYGAAAAARLGKLGLEVDTLLEDGEAARRAAEAEALFVGGGNTFRLLLKLQRNGLIETVRRRALGGMPYLGSSAGTVVAAPTIGTTNDMPIVAPDGLGALGLVPFHINCHYLDPDPASRHMGETRETRLREFLEENEGPVLGLREGAWLRVRGSSVRLEGAAGARLFARGAEPVEHAPGSDLGFLCRS